MSARRLLAAAFVALAVILAPVGVGAAASGGDVLTLPYDSAINTDDSVSTYERTGAVTTEYTTPQMTVTIADEREDVGLGWTTNPLEGDTRNDFIRLTYREEISRTVAIPIRAAYWTPFPRDGLEALNSDHTASMSLATEDGERYTILTVTFNGKGTAVFPVPSDAAAVYSAVERTEDRTNSTFGINLGLTPTAWNRIDPAVFRGNTTVRIEGDPEKIMIQYNAGTPDDPEWVPAPDDRGRTVPVYVMERDGVDAVYVVTTTNDTTQIRYKRQGGVADRVGGYVREAQQIPGRISDGLDVDIPDLNILTAARRGVV